jgi:hypothetical protein
VAYLVGGENSAGAPTSGVVALKALP